MKYYYLKVLVPFACVLGCISEPKEEERFLEDHQALQLDSLIDTSIEMMFGRSYDESRYLMDTIDVLSIMWVDSARWAMNQNNYGIWNYFKGDFQSSVKHYSTFLQWSESIGDSAAVSETHKNIGISWKALGYLELATEQYLLALKWNPVHRQTYTASLHNSLGNLFLTVEEYTSAIFHFKEAEDIWKRLENGYLYPMALHNIGEAQRMKLNFDSAIYFFDKALRLKKEYGDSSSMFHTMNSLGRTYLDQGNSIEAFPLILKSMKYFQEIEAKKDYVISLFLLTGYYLQENQLPLAGQYLDLSGLIIDSLESRDLRIEWLSLAKEYSQHLEKWQDVVLLDYRLDSLRDILYKQERLYLVQEEDAYRLEQEEQRTQRAEDQRQFAEIISQRRQRISWTIGGIAAILLIGLMIIYRQRRQIGVLNADLKQLNFDIRHRKQNDYHRILAYFSVAREQMPALSAVMQPVENMLMASAQVDELLYRQQEAHTVGIKRYLEDLLQELQAALSLNQRVPVDLQVDIEHIQLPPDHAAKLAYIVAEWITNVYKHSFELAKMTQEARVWVQISRIENQVKVALADNGKGVTQHTLEDSTGLGWKLIKGFVANLRGQLALGAEAGARFTLTFPLE